MGMYRRPTALAVALGAIASGVLALVTVIPALGNHIPGATYSGSHDGGSTMQVRVSGSGSSIEHFEVSAVPCGAGFVSLGLDYSPGAVPIDANHQFSYTGVGIQRLSFTGSFPSAGQAMGTLRYQQSNIPFVQPACDSGTLNWSATTSAPTPSATQSPTETSTATPEPTESPTGTPEPSPTPTLPAEEKLWGDSDCDGEITTRDNQALLRKVLDQNPLSQTEPCFDLGDAVVADGDAQLWGDSDCDGEITTRDNQALLRKVLDQNPLSQTEPCPDIGSAVAVT